MDVENNVGSQFLYIPRRALTTSLYLHLSLVILFLIVKILGYFGVHVFPMLTRPAQTVYQNYIQVDVVGLPDQRLGEMVDTSLPEVDSPSTSKKPEALAFPKPDDSPALPPEISRADAKRLAKKEADKLAEMHRAEQDKALKRIAEEAKREAALKGLASKPGKAGRSKLKGNILSKGTATSGAIGNEHDRYVGLVNQAIKKHFKLYAWQTKRGLSAVVYIEIYPTGMLRQKKIVQSSPDNSYNQAALNAIDAALPLPIPEDLALLSEGFNITFKPEDQK